MAADFNSIEQSVKQNTDAEQSATALVNHLADALDGLTNDPVAIKALAGDLRKNASALGKAVVDNTQQSKNPQGQAPAQSTSSAQPPQKAQPQGGNPQAGQAGKTK